MRPGPRPQHRPCPPPPAPAPPGLFGSLSPRDLGQPCGPLSRVPAPRHGVALAPGARAAAAAAAALRPAAPGGARQGRYRPQPPAPRPWPGRHPPPGAGIPREAAPRAPRQRSRFFGRQGIDWPGRSLVFDPKQLLSRASHPRPRLGSSVRLGVGCEEQRPDPPPQQCGEKRGGGALVPRQSQPQLPNPEIGTL